MIILSDAVRSEAQNLKERPGEGEIELRRGREYRGRGSVRELRM